MKISCMSQAILSVGRGLYTLILCSLVLPLALTAQVNLVPNPSFESKNSVPVGSSTTYNPKGENCMTRLNVAPYSPAHFTDPVFVNNWFRGNQSTSDYFHRGATFPDSIGDRVPQNWGQDEDLNPPSDTGDAYAGFGMTRLPSAYAGSPVGAYDYHEFIAVKLSNHLKSNTEYLIQFKYAMPKYSGSEQRGNPHPTFGEYYLKKLSVAFASDTSFLEYDNTTRWWARGTGGDYNALAMSLYPGNHVDVRELPYANPRTWQTFEGRLLCTDSTLEYIIIGNFDRRISLDDIGLVPGIKLAPSDSNSYNFYFFIDDVSVQEVETGSCTCDNIFTCPHTRDTTLELSHENTCCFTTPIKLRPGSCRFSAIRVKASGVTISDPPITNYGHIVTDTETVYVSFCTPFHSDSTQTYIEFQFLDADSVVLCTKAGVVQCNCMCTMAGANIAEGVPVIIVEDDFKKVEYDSTKCCWEFSLKNNYSCTFKDDFYLEVADNGSGAIYTALTGWKDTVFSGKHHFSSTTGGLKYNSNSPVFRVCVLPQYSTTPPVLTAIFKELSREYSCRSFDNIKLECVGEESCCDLLNITLRKHSNSLAPCAFDLVISNKSGMNKCKVFGVRVLSGGDTVYTLTPQSAPLNFDTAKQVWYQNLGDCHPLTTPPNSYEIFRAYTVEILDSTGAVKCSFSDTIRCCYLGAPFYKESLEESKPEPIPLSVGGVLSETTIEGNSIHYSVKNMGDDLPAKIRLTGLKGNIITERKLNLTKGNSAGEFDISHLPSGTYFISVQTDLWQTSRQISIVR